MPAYVSTLIYLMALGTVCVDVALVALVIALFGKKMRTRIQTFAQTYGVLLVLILALLSVAGTLLMQFAGALVPCILCWWQRICMYPIALISLIAFLKNAKFSDIADYVLALSVFGALFSLYQHLLQVTPAGTLIPCDPTNDCAARLVFDFGFVTIPWMALTMFAVFIVLALVGRKGN